jgi:T5SS/PEP-CTERM-associated repeat protein
VYRTSAVKSFLRAVRLASVLTAGLLALCVSSRVQAAITTAGNVTPAPPSAGGSVAGPFLVGDTAFGQVTISVVPLNVTGSSITLGQSPNGIGIVTVSGVGSSLTSANDINVGNAGAGNLIVSQQGQPGLISAADDMLVGIATGSTGNVFLDTLGTVANITDTIDVGQAGTGLVQVTGGARLNAAVGIIGQAASGEGTVTVSGNGSIWHQSGTITIGEAGRGVMQVLSQGHAETTNAILGNQANSSGTMSVTGVGSDWDIAGFLTMSASGQSTLNVVDGGRVSATGATRMGTAAAGEGRVVVSGANSLFSAGSTISVGETGYGALRITTGGRATSGNSVIGDNTGSRGEVLVDGINSTWAITGTLLVSDPGEATVTVSNGGLLSTTGAITVGAAGELLLSGGRVQIAGGLGLSNQGLVLGGGRIAAPVTNSAAGEIRTRATDVLVVSSLANSGQVDLQGGELEVLAAATNSGDIDAFGSVLRFDGGLTNTSAGQISITSGTVDIYGNVTNNSNGKIIVGDRAEAIFHDTVTNNGQLVVLPGGNALMLENLSLTNAAAVTVQLAGDNPDTDYGQLDVGGAANLGGALNVTLANGFTPQAGDSYQLLTAGGGLTGTFASQSLPSLSAGLSWDVDYSATSVTLSVVAGLRADFNHDGMVNSADLAVWKAGFGTPTGATSATGDADGDGDVDGADFILWQHELGAAANSPAAASVPEPAALGLAIASAFAAVCSRRRR